MTTISVVSVGDTATQVIEELARSRGTVQVVRRCPELSELLAACQSGLAQVAVVAQFTEELTATLIDRLTAVGVLVVAVAATAEQSGRLQSAGATTVPETITATALTDTIRLAVEGLRHPSSVGFSVPSAPLPSSSAAQPVLQQHEPETDDVGPPARAANAPSPVPSAGESLPRKRGWHLRAKNSGAHDQAQAVGINSAGPGQRPVDSGSIVAVWGPTGSPGRTTVAINLAAEQAVKGHKVLLIDADSYGASVAAALGLLDEAASFAQACRVADQGGMSTTELAKTVTQLVFEGGSFSLLTGLTRADRWPELRAAAVERVLDAARKIAEVVIVDCGFALENDEELSYDTVAPRRNAATLAVLGRADLVYAVGNSDPIGIPRLIRGLDELGQACPGSTIKVVVNKVRRKAVGGAPERSLVYAWERFGPDYDIAHFLPWDPDLTDKALLEGRLLRELSPDAPLSIAIRGMSCAADQ